MKIGILQPSFLPWLGFFEQIYQSDHFVIYDDVQYDKQGWRNRNRVKTQQGIQWLTVPVLHRFSEKPSINEICIDNYKNWSKKHLKTIAQAYSKAPFFSEYYPFIEDIYTRPWERLLDLNIYAIEQCLLALGINNKQITLSSALCLPQMDKQERLIEICKKFNADRFYEGAAGSNYICVDTFAKAGVEVCFQDYQHPVYAQLHGEFVSHLSIIDLLFNHGSQSLSVLLNHPSL